jgi:dimethylaniline monooxygenase (N-oxide forming)
MKTESNALKLRTLFFVSQTKVCSVRKHPDFSSSSQWNVVVEDDGEQKTYVFDGVMICSGHYNEKYLPIQDFAGIF